MDHKTLIPDEMARLTAETTFDRNVVVIAGAGTGKTTLLVNRLIHAVMREPDPLDITEVLALTFTNKAATEMKVRLRERLNALGGRTQAYDTMEGTGVVSVTQLCERYGLTPQEVASRAEAALHDLEKAQIGTLHSFAAHVLRLYPLESEVDPGFREDDGSRFAEHFDEQWHLWLAGELGAEGRNHAAWRTLFQVSSLEGLRHLALAVCSELVSVEELTRQISNQSIAGPIHEWTTTLHRRAEGLLGAHDREKRRKVETLLSAAADVFRLVAEGKGVLRLSIPVDLRHALNQNLGAAPAGWSEAEYAEARGLLRIARQILSVDHELIKNAMDCLMPLVAEVRRSFLAQGWISFDGLLARARGLLRDHTPVRERLKRAYRSILIDEFQDTDPVQYEIVFYLAEQFGRCSTVWSDVVLEPGKLFIVGDPKQSIYAFRRADMEAFDRVVARILAYGGTVQNLVTNFRSHARVLDKVNAVFDQLFHQQVGVQPANVRLLARPDRREGVVPAGVQVRLVKAKEQDEEFDSTAATRVEADVLAKWLKEELLTPQTLRGRSVNEATLRLGHVALLFRKLTQAHEYLDALRRHDIPYVTDGERHFYRRQEVVDVVNVLRAIENPHDAIGLVGILRSALGGLTDRDIYELQGREALDYRAPQRLEGWESPKRGIVHQLYEELRRLSRAVHSTPLPSALDQIWDALPLRELAAASLHGEQALANVLKIREIAHELADRTHLTFTNFVELMIARLEEQPAEGESALAEPSLDAVHVLTIHKAKGLEFPVVILPGIHQGGGSGGGQAPIVSDWSTGVLGVSLEQHCTMGAILVGQKSRTREDAERRRVLYVGMTRAKELLILSGGVSGQAAHDSFLRMLEESGWEWDEAATTKGSDQVSPLIVTAVDQWHMRRAPPVRDLRPARDWSEVLRVWERRDQGYAIACATPRHITPTRLREKWEPENAVKSGKERDAERARLIGTLTHQVLEDWDFQGDEGQLDRRVEAVCHRARMEDSTGDGQAIREEIMETLSGFLGSEAYLELCGATILGREIPFIVDVATPQSSTGQSASQSSFALCSSQPTILVSQSCVLSGTIDVIYRKNGHVWVADYKTDRVSEEDLGTRAAVYRDQACAYAGAVSRVFGLEKVRAKLIFLRQGRAVEV